MARVGLTPKTRHGRRIGRILLFLFEPFFVDDELEFKSVRVLKERRVISSAVFWTFDRSIQNFAETFLGGRSQNLAGKPIHIRSVFGCECDMVVSHRSLRMRDSGEIWQNSQERYFMRGVQIAPSPILVAWALSCECVSEESKEWCVERRCPRQIGYHDVHVMKQAAMFHNVQRFKMSHGHLWPLPLPVGQPF